MKIFLDMDGVLSNLVASVVDVFPIREGAREFIDRWRRKNPGKYDLAPRIHEAIPKDIRPEEFSVDDLWKQIDQKGIDFWRDVDRYPWTDDLWRGCKAIAGDDVFISSSPTRSADCVAGKAAWLREEFSIGPNRYMLGSRKDLLAAPDRVLVDDAEKNVDAFRDAGGHAILFPGPWNSNHERIGVELAWTMAELGRIGAEIAASKK